MDNANQTGEVKKTRGKPARKFIYNAVFEQPEMEQVILGPTPDPEGRTVTRKAPDGTPVALAHLWDVPLLTIDQERHLFRKMNYLRFKAEQMTGTGKVAVRKRAQMMEQITVVRNQIMQANLRLVVGIARKALGKVYRAPSYKFKFDEGELLALVSDGNMSLMRAIDGYDYGRGFKFSTYASSAVQKNFFKSVKDSNEEAARSRQSSSEEFFDFRADGRTDEHQVEARHQSQVAYATELLDTLDERDRQVLMMRMYEELTLDQVGEHFGITKERVRQIQAAALKKLRLVADENRVEL